MSSQVDLKLVVVSKNILTFINKLRELNIGPSGQANKLQTLLVAMDYVVSKVPETGVTEGERELIHAATITKCKVQHWKKGITKQKAQQATRKKEFVSENLQSPKEVMEFLNSDEMKGRIELLGDSEEDVITLRR